MEKKKIPHSPEVRKNLAENSGELSAIEQQFVTNYIRIGNATEAVRKIPNLPERTPKGYYYLANKLLKKERVQLEIKRIMDELKNETMATAEEVMTYFTAVMRGEVKDQFGLDAPLSERTKAAQELAKRTIDIENRNAGEPDQLVAIKLDWSRDK